MHRFLKDLLHQPHDFPSSVFYTKVMDGGIGIPCFRWFIPMDAHRRNVASKPYLRFQLTAPDGTAITSPAMYKKDFHHHSDGKGLQQSAQVPHPHSWLTDGSSFLTGRDYIAATHLLYNCLFSKSHAARVETKTTFALEATEGQKH